MGCCTFRACSRALVGVRWLSLSICHLIQVQNLLSRLTLIVVVLEYLVTRGTLLRRNRFMYANFALIVVTCSLSAPAIAQDENEWQSWPLVDHFTISLHAMFPNLDTRVRLDASDTSPGTTIVFEQNLGMSDTESVPAICCKYSFGGTPKFQRRFR